MSSGTSRPSQALFGRSEIVAHMGLFGLALVVPCFSRPETAKVVSYDADLSWFLRRAVGAATHAAGGQMPSSGISCTLLSA